jgi:hypothetical protein
MYEYTVKLPFKIENCLNCPFRHEMIMNEGVESLDKLTGVMQITRRLSCCNLKDEPILMNESVESYNSKCPLKGKSLYLPDDKEIH